MFSRCALVLLLCFSTGLAATLIPAASAEETPTGEPVAFDPLLQPVDPSIDPAVDPAFGDDKAQAEHLVQDEQNRAQPAQATEEDESDWGFGSIRDSFQAVNGYFDSVVELMGGRNGVCQYRCRYGKAPQTRPGYQIPEPNGCTSALLGFQIDMGIPAMTKCCNQLDVCYDTCGSNKYRCDTKFRWCLHGICKDLKNSLGFVSKVEACETFADTMYNTVWTLGCRPFMNSQRAACICEGEEKDEL
ncbi:group XIIB secretory phospholipase A2-like protein isoform X2 [Astyanax mexicanus]|uniref:group XIIB secretory phospholipase A2-like protein isoform X2 n=1 Tax=Astyanax mexicanus TaxID=7994 RepID=UPI000BBD5700|nr:group XIIB secretory phospholipase A2-like protein isoform X2 [Astyanax mexicanus]